MPARVLAAALLLALAMPAQAAAKPVFSEPDDGPDPRGLTVYGSGLGRVESPPRLSERTIERALAAARRTAQARALRDARTRAVALADDAGLTLGRIAAISDQVPHFERLDSTIGHCRRRGRPPQLRCRVRPFAAASIRVTFATAETSAVVPSGPAVIASASAGASVKPRRMTNASARAALRRAQLVADPLALAGALRRAAGAAEAAGLGLGSLFAVAEEPRQPFFPDITSGTFGPGRFCRTIRRARFRADRVTDERRRVRGPQCYVPSASSVLRVTFAALP